MSFKYYYKNMIIFLNNYKITKYFNSWTDEKLLTQEEQIV